MKKECDANGLEYELLMQESAKERFLREIKGNQLDLSKHLVILKQKRQSASSTAEPIVAAPAPSSEEPIVGANEPTNSAAPAAPGDSIVGAPLSAAIASLGGKAAIAGKSAFANLASPKLLVTLRERLGNIRRSSTSIPFPRLHASTTPVSRISFAPFPTFKPLVVQPYNLF